ncbi:MAG: hypothetical protein IIT56_12505 [Bacteroidales bacterium]|nr:hypothetical protein [Bacteroidales bacterium]
MTTTIVSDYAWYFPVLCFVAAAFLTGLSYYKNKKLAEFQPYKIYILSALRFSALFLSMILLLNIFIKTNNKRIEKPVLAIAVDNSESIVLRSGQESADKVLDEIFAAKEKLDEKYNVRFFKFGESFSQISERGALNFKDKYTDFSDMFEAVKSVLYNTNSGAVLTVSDGVCNKGQNPVYSAAETNQKVYTLTIGDTTSYKDLSVSKVLYNESAFLGNEFPLEITLNAKMLKGKNTVCQVLRDGKTVFQETFEVKSDNYSKEISLSLKADKKGLQKYTVLLKPVADEITEVNNSKEIVIEVIDDKYKILLLSANAHPDVAAFRNALSKNLSYETEVFTVENFTKKASGYDLVILFGLPSTKVNADGLFEEISSRNIPTLYVLGSSTDYQKFNRINKCLEITPKGNNFDDAVFGENPKFPLFSFENGVDEMLRNTPPLSCVFGDYKLLAATHVFGYQIIKGVTTQKPLIAVSEPQKAKSAVILGQGIWRWRMDCYRKFLNHEKFDLLIGRLVQFLLKKSDKEMFTVAYKKIFSENELVYFNAKVLDEMFQPVSDSQVTIEISDENGVKKDYKFENTGSGYYLRIDNLLPGNYSFTAKSSHKKSVKTGVFSVKEIKTEAENLTANLSVMKQIAAKTDGKSFLPNEIPALLNDLLENAAIKPTVYNDTVSSPLMGWKWLFFIILALLTAEWFLRKFWGTV